MKIVKTAVALGVAMALSHSASAKVEIIDPGSLYGYTETSCEFVGEGANYSDLDTFDEYGSFVNPDIYYTSQSGDGGVDFAESSGAIGRPVSPEKYVYSAHAIGHNDSRPASYSCVVDTKSYSDLSYIFPDGATYYIDVSWGGSVENVDGFMNNLNIVFSNGDHELLHSYTEGGGSQSGSYRYEGVSDGTHITLSTALGGTGRSSAPYIGDYSYDIKGTMAYTIGELSPPPPPPSPETCGVPSYKDGIVTIPCVKVPTFGGTELYKAKMDIVLGVNPLTFTVSDATRIADTAHRANECTAVFENGQLHFPCVTVGVDFNQTTYDATLKIINNTPFTFELVDAKIK